MEYFQAALAFRDKSLLRAKFKTATQAKTEKLAVLFAPVAKALLESATKDEKLIIGLFGDGFGGKTPFAEALIVQILNEYTRKSMMNAWSNIYTTDQDTNIILHHYDIEGIASMGFGGSNPVPLKIRHESEQAEFTNHTKAIEDSHCQIIEWLKLDSQINMLWNMTHDLPSDADLENQSDREISFYASEDIEEMPEYQQFLKDAAEFRIA